jgi:BTB/POZ domain/BTB And C-terminal Kelch/Kelch motif
MVFKTIKSEKYNSTLLSAVAGLLDDPTIYSDVKIQVGTVIFECHKVILALQSSYFHQHLFEAGKQTAVHQITLKDVNAEDFHNVLRYLYKGEIQLDTMSVGRIVRLAKLIRLEELKQICYQFMMDTMNVHNCVQYWRYDVDKLDSAFKDSCIQIFSKNFLTITAANDLRNIPQDLMEAVLGRDDLNVSSETEVCQVIIQWFDTKIGSIKSTALLKLLSQIRWSAVPVDYVRSLMIGNEMLRKDRQCYDYLSRVVTYRLRGIQFDGLCTNYRSSIGLESCIVIFGTYAGNLPTADSYRISLQNENCFKISKIPTQMQHEAIACVNNNSAYVIGIGANCKETWRWDSVGGWVRCGNMVEGRRRHCATFVNNTSMYALGGFVDSTKTTLASVEQFDTMKNIWTTVGNLVNAVRSAGCASYKTSIYMFGGTGRDTDTDEDVDLNCVQVFDTTNKQCTELTQRLPQSERLLRAVVWDTSVILMNSRSCIVFDMDHHNIQQRDQFKAGVSQFGLVLNNQKLFVVGGGLSSTDSYGNRVWTYTDEVKCVPVSDIISNQQTVNWIRHSKMSSPSLVLAYSLMTLPAV